MNNFPCHNVPCHTSGEASLVSVQLEQLPRGAVGSPLQQEDPQTSHASVRSVGWVETQAETH